MLDDVDSLADFQGTARLFPLPNLVFFPHVVQPLHIFEPRYRQMTRDALDDDRLIALVLPRPGWDTNYEGKFDIHSVATLGRIIADQQLEDGRYNLLLRGLARIRILEEMDFGKLYRSARAEVISEFPVIDHDVESCLRQELRLQAPKWFTHTGQAFEQFERLLQSDLPLGMLADIVSFALPLANELRQALLEQPCVCQRLDLLLRHFARRRKFPPEFSLN